LPPADPKALPRILGRSCVEGRGSQRRSSEIYAGGFNAWGVWATWGESWSTVSCEEIAGFMWHAQVWCVTDRPGPEGCGDVGSPMDFPGRKSCGFDACVRLPVVLCVRGTRGERGGLYFLGGNRGFSRKCSYRLEFVPVGSGPVRVGRESYGFLGGNREHALIGQGWGISLGLLVSCVEILGYAKAPMRGGSHRGFAVILASPSRKWLFEGLFELALDLCEVQFFVEDESED
jgi:hypothetical protein